MSVPDIDFEHAPKTCAKALEITKDCKTDAEKIAAVYNYVSKTIKYNYARYNKVKANKTNTTQQTTCYEDPKNGKHTIPADNGIVSEFDLDYILTSKSGVCRHIATLTAGMLRSLGIQCKVVEELAGNVAKNKPMEANVWIAVKPETNKLNKTALGVGLDYDWIDGKLALNGWTRLDPTNYQNKTFTANGKNYDTLTHH